MPVPDTPTVSVIVPVHNGERYLAATLESILAQDHRPLELIVVDDGSTDGSAAVATSFEAVHCVRQANAGVSAARNAGAEGAGGDLLGFCDADDLWLPGKLSAQVAHLDEHPEAGCVVVRSETFLEPGTEPPAWMAGNDEDLHWGDPLVRREVWEKAGGFDPEIGFGERFEWLTRIRDAGFQVAALDAPLTRRRIHGANLSHERAKLQETMLKVIRDRTRRAPGAG